MGDGLQQHVALPRPRGLAGQGAAQVALDHRVDRLRLPPPRVPAPLATLLRPEHSFHVPSPAAGGRAAVLARAADVGRDQRPQAHVPAGQPVVGLGVVARVAGHREGAVGHPPPGVEHQPLEVRVVAAHPRAGPRRQDQVAAGRDAQRELGQPPHRVGAGAFAALFRFFGPHPLAGLAAPSLVVAADVVRLEVRAVDRQRLGREAEDPRDRGPLGDPVQELARRPGPQQERGGPLQRVVVGDAAQADVLAPVLTVAQDRLGPAVAALEQLLDRQAGEQLRQGEVLAGEFTRVLRKGLARQQVGDPHHLPWRFAGQHDTSNTTADPAGSAAKGEG